MARAIVCLWNPCCSRTAFGRNLRSRRQIIIGRPAVDLVHDRSCQSYVTKTGHELCCPGSLKLIRYVRSGFDM